MRSRKPAIHDKGPCNQNGCEAPAEVAGFCKACYTWWRYGIHITREAVKRMLYSRRRLALRYEQRAGMTIHANQHTTVGTLFGSGQMRTATANRRSRRGKP